MDERFGKIQTIYDLVIYAYEQVRGKSEAKLMSLYREQFPDEWEEITRWMREAMMGNLSVKDFVKALEDDLRTDKQLVCMHLLMEFDRYYKERNQYPLIRESVIQKTVDYHIENHISEDLVFYPMGQDNFMMDSEIMSKSRRHRIRDGIWDVIESYRIHKTDKSERCVTVRKYNDTGIERVLAECGCLTVAVVPFSNQAPFDRDSQTGILKMKDYSPKEIGKMFRDCTALLEELDKEGADIVIFPEIVMTEELVVQVKKWLVQRAIRGTNLKLLFMGSYYTDDRNRCVLLSGAGKLLLTNDKQNGFEYTDKSGRQHRELLGEKEDTVCLIDVKGLGRVWYLICKDALVFQEAVKMAGEYNCNVYMVSSYSRSVSDFKNVGESLAAVYQALSIVSNSCAARKGKETGVISYPVFDAENKHLLGNSMSYQCNTVFEVCAYGRCAHVFRFYVNDKSICTVTKSTGENTVNHKWEGLKIEYKQLKNQQNGQDGS